MARVTVDSNGLAIQGAPALIQAGALHYFRLPHPDLWRPVLTRMRMAGLNAVIVPFPWSYHSPAPGFYDFTGPRDIDRLLVEAERAGLWLIPHVGPWLGMDLDSGGVPVWVQRFPVSSSRGISQGRTAADGRLCHVAEWWAQLLPKIAQRENLIAVAVDAGPGVELVDPPSNAESLIDLVCSEVTGVPCVVSDAVYASLQKTPGSNSPSHSPTLLTWTRFGLQAPPQSPTHGDASQSLALLDPTVPATWLGGRRKSVRELAGDEHPRALLARTMTTRQAGYVLNPVHESINWGWWGTAGHASQYGHGAPIAAVAIPPDNYYPARRMALTLETLGGILALPSASEPLLDTAESTADLDIAGHAVDSSPSLTAVPPDVLLGERHAPAGRAVFLQGNQGPENLVHLALGDDDDARLVEDIPLEQGQVRVLPLDWQLSECCLSTTTMEPVLRTTVAGRELLILLNETGGEVLLPSDLRIRHHRGPVYVEHTAQGLVVHFDPARIASLVLDSPSRGTLQLLALEPRMAARVWPLDDMWRTTPFHPATWTPAEEEPARGVVIGPDLVVPEADGAFRLLAAGRGFGYRWGPWRGSDPHTWLSPLTWRGARPIPLPTLTWSSVAGAPEALPDYDDRSWRVGVPPLAMEAQGVDYGFIWYRGHFDASASSVTMACRHACDLFLNGHHIASLSAPPDFGPVHPKTLPLPDRYLRNHNVLAVLAENQGRSVVTDPFTASHGLIACELDATEFAQWRVRGGLTGERRRQGFPGFADWPSIQPADSADITWHRSVFRLAFPLEVEAGLYLVLDQTPTKCYIYLNGYLIGRLWYPQSEERRFWLPDGILRRRGDNELLVAQWTRGADPGIGFSCLEADTTAIWHRVDVS